jgi:hypothetical protein
MATYLRYQFAENTQSCAMYGYDAFPYEDTITLWTGGVAGLRFGFYGTKGLAVYSGGTMVFFIEDLTVTNIVVDGATYTTPSPAIAAIYSVIT